MKYILLSISLAFLAGCSTSRISNTRFDTEGAWSQYKTFNFFDRVINTDTLSGAETVRLEQLKNVITAEMQKAGYALSNVAPDLLVNMGITIIQTAQSGQNNLTTYIGQRNYTWKNKELEAMQFATGTAIIEIVDAKNKNLLWSGTLEGLFPSQEARVESTVKEGVARLFKQHPVPKPAPRMSL